MKLERGEDYRHSLQRRAEELGISKNVIFHNRFVELQELMEFLGAADIYVTSYLNEAQITSGTLAYALGAGKAAVSTRNMLARFLPPSREEVWLAKLSLPSYAKDQALWNPQQEHRP